MTVPVATRDDAMRWIIDHQLGRHNLTEEQKSALRGQRYLLKKTAGHGEAVPQNEGPTTAERLADEYQVGHASIERDGEFVEGLDALKTVREDLPEPGLLPRFSAPSCKKASCFNDISNV
jgi:hypothetical protein